MKKKLIYLILPIVALVLEILPYGAVCIFASPPNQTYRVTYSYFDLLPFGCANFAPFLTAVITCAVILMLSVYLFNDKCGVLKTVKSLLLIASVLSLCPILYGVRFFSAVGALISAALISELVLLSKASPK